MAVATITKLFAVILIASALAAPAFAFDIRPDQPKDRSGSIRIDGHSRELACDRTKNHRGPMTADRRDEVLLRYCFPARPHPDYEIDHLIPLCLGGSDDFSNLWPQPRRSIEPKWNAEAKDRLDGSCATWFAAANLILRPRRKPSPRTGLLPITNTTKLIDAKLGEASVRHNSSRAISISLARRVQSVPSIPLLISAC